MRSSHILFSAVHLLIALFVLAVGMILILLSYEIPFQRVMYNLVRENPFVLFYSGGFVLFSGIVLLLGFAFMHRKSYYTLQMTPNKVFIEENILKEYVREYWKTVFPDHVVDLEVVVNRDQTIEIITGCPSEKEEQQELFERIENELGVLLARKLGYKREFRLTITA